MLSVSLLPLQLNTAKSLLAAAFNKIPAEDLGRPLFQACMLHLSYQTQCQIDVEKVQIHLNTLQLLYQINTHFHWLLASLHKNCKFYGQGKWREREHIEPSIVAAYYLGLSQNCVFKYFNHDKRLSETDGNHLKFNSVSASLQHTYCFLMSNCDLVPSYFILAKGLSMHLEWINFTSYVKLENCP